MSAHGPLATPETTTRRQSALVVAGLAAVGVLAGVVAKAADESGITWAGDLGTYPAAWVLTVALIGRAASTWRTAAMRAAAFFATMTLAYYAYAAWVLGFGWNRLLPVWLILSATAVAGAAVASWWGTRRAGPLPGALMGLAAGIALAGGSVQRLFWVWTGVMPELAARPVQAAVDVVTALVLTLVLPRRWSTRLWAIVLAVPMVWLAGRCLDLLYTVVS